jgi:hypothetical protein
MLSFLQDLIAFPIQILVFIGRKGQIPALIGLQKIVFFIKKSPDEAVKYLNPIFATSQETGLAETESILNRYRDGYFYAVLGSHYLAISGDKNKVDTWISEAEGQEITNKHMLSYLKLINADTTQAAYLAAEEILKRNDYPSYVTVLAFYHRTIQLIESEKLQEAQELIERTLSIQETIPMRILSIALAIKRGEDYSKQLGSMHGGGENSENRSYMISSAAEIAGDYELMRSELAKMKLDSLKKIRGNSRLAPYAREILQAYEK